VTSTPPAPAVLPACPGCSRPMLPGTPFCCRPCAVSGDGRERHDQACDERVAGQAAAAALVVPPQAGLFPELEPGVVVVDVPGRPTPQGSKKPHSNCGQTARACPNCRRPHVVNMHVSEEAGEHLKEWRKQIAAAARRVMTGRPQLSGPLDLRLVFTIARPKSHYRTGRYAHLLKDDSPAWPDSDPDWDKLSRAVCDALSKVVWPDDNQVVHADVWECYDRDAPRPPGALGVAGVRITVSQMG
jgi:Holliday junction resolvase RusA-like endonuclease